MSKKYVIEIKPEYEDSFKGLMILGAKDSNLFVDTLAVEDLEELNSDYINEHFGDLQQDAYDRGYKDGRNVTETQAHDDAYQRGLNDAWEAVRKVIHLPESVVLDLFTDCYSSVCTVLQVFLKYEGSEVIAKLKAYEEKQKADDKIEVGDEVIFNNTMKCLVVKPESDEGYAALIDSNGNHHSAENCDCKKTGRHFNIESILEAIKHD